MIPKVKKFTEMIPKVKKLIDFSHIFTFGPPSDPSPRSNNATIHPRSSG
jgi:hypothetical protein